MRKAYITLFFLGIVFFAVTSVALASPKDKFTTGWYAFHDLVENSKKAKYRSYWMQVKNHFWKAYKQNPQGSYAPKSLYYLGRVYEELGKRSWLKKDFIQANDYFQRVVSHFPEHSWSDDAQLRKAKIHLDYLKDPVQAYVDLLNVVHNYPKGDMYSEAKSLLRQLDKANVDVGAPSPRPPRPKPKPATSYGKKKGSSSGSYARLENIRHWSSDDYTRIVLDVNDEIDFSHTLLDPDPKLGTTHRLFLDLDETRLSPRTSTKYTISDGILRQVRIGQYRNDQARVVLDIQGLDHFKVFSLNNPFRIVIDVYAPERKSTTVASVEPEKQIQIDDQNNEHLGSLVEQLGLTVKTVMIDPGHGGKDPGAVANGILEKDINLRMSKILGRLLEKKGFTVLYTRTTDKFIPLEERTAMANQKKADLFLSIHCNAHKVRKLQGFELYYLNLARSKDAVRVAARENAVSEKKISDLQVILTELILHPKIEESNKLATDVHRKTMTYIHKHYPGIRDHGVREAPFYVLMGAKMPAILIELGYITNKYEAKRLRSASYLTRMAQGIVNGVLGYKQRTEQLAGLY